MELSRQDRMSLIRFVCNAAWGDVEIQDEEKTHILKMADRLKLEEDEVAQVEKWLKSPPPIDSVDPTAIPRRHRELFLKEMKAIVDADGVITDEEEDLLSLMTALLHPGA